MLQLLMNRDDFPILSRTVYDKPLVYFDNAATTQKPQAVIDALTYCYSQVNANVHRGVHYLSQEATRLHEASRQKVADFLGAPSADNIVFTRGTTESINLVAATLGESMQAGDEVLISQMEHHSNIVPWHLLASRKGIKVRFIPVLDNGELDMSAFRSMLSSRTRLVSITHVSNVLGTINPIEDIVEESHRVGAWVLIDGAQAAAHIPLDMQQLDADFYAFSGHKLYAPTGIGVLYGKQERLAALPPYQGGGEMIEQVHESGSTYLAPPLRFEAGTPDYVASHALGVAIDYLQSIGIDRIAAHEDELLHYATDRLLSTVPNLRIIGNAKHKSAVISFTIDNTHPFDIGTLLDRLGIAIRTGHHCAQPLMERYALTSTARLSMALYNTKAEIDTFIEALRRVHSMLA